METRGKVQLMVSTDITQASGTHLHKRDPGSGKHRETTHQDETTPTATGRIATTARGLGESTVRLPTTECIQGHKSFNTL